MAGVELPRLVSLRRAGARAHGGVELDGRGGGERSELGHERRVGARQRPVELLAVESGELVYRLRDRRLQQVGVDAERAGIAVEVIARYHSASPPAGGRAAAFTACTAIVSAMAFSDAMAPPCCFSRSRRSMVGWDRPTPS